jgi:glutathione S-transferase
MLCQGNPEPEEPMLTLYYSPGSCALASHIALEEAGADYKTIRLDFAQNDQRAPDYLAINPKGRVPALVTEQGILTESPAILVYIAQRFPQAGLAPLADPFAFARLQSFNSYLCSTVHVAHAHRMRGYRWADDPAALAEMKRKVPQTVGEAFQLVERHMFAGPWVLGQNFSVCDGYLFTMAQWLKDDGVDIATLPRIHDHHNRMLERPAVKKVLADERRALAA